MENQLNKNILCGIIYRHPNSNLERFLDQLYSAIEHIEKEYKYCILIGSFQNTMNSNLFEPHILSPTRINDYSATLKDNMFQFNWSIDFPISGNLIHDLTHHLSKFLIIDQFDHNISVKEREDL